MELKNQPCYNADGEFLGWFSRSVAATIMVVAKDREGNRYVLASERGPGAADFQGYWNMPCGYLDFNETVAEAACRECYEETGIKVKPDEAKFFDFNSEPSANRQNVTFRFLATLKEPIEDLTFSKENNEEDEVGMIEWVPFDGFEGKKWAFGHDKIIRDAIENFFSL